MKNIFALLAGVFLIGGCCAGMRAVELGGLSLRIDFPEAIAVPRPPGLISPDEPTQASLGVGFFVENKGRFGLKIRTLGSGAPAWYARVVFKLLDESGKEVPGGFQATENYAGSVDLKEIGLAPGKGMHLPYYKRVPFLIHSTGRYTLYATARIQDERNNWVECQAKPVSFTVVWSHDPVSLPSAQDR